MTASSPAPAPMGPSTRRSHLGLLAALLLAPCTAPAQMPQLQLMDEQAPERGAFKLWRPNGPSAGLVLLLPPYGGGVDYYDSSRLPELLGTRRLAFAVLHPGQLGYLERADMQILNAMVAKALQLFEPSLPVAIGGFSSGGFGALRYAVLAWSGQEALAVRPAAAFSVDAPLDLERWYQGMDTHQRRRGDQAQDAFVGESRFLVGHLRRLMGGTPQERPEVYRSRSVLSATLPDGGNARYLRDLPLRLYAEPDMAFYIEHGLDYGSANAYDQVALTSVLRAQGGQKVSLVLTSGKGVRPDLGGMRMPHAWSIVDEDELAQWLAEHLLR